MSHDELEETARHRLRSLRQARGWTIDELARRSHVGPSTISRLETGHRRLTIDHLAVLARTLETSVDELLRDTNDDVVIRPIRQNADGVLVWMLSRRDDPSGIIVARMQFPADHEPPEPRVHPGRDFFYVLEGTIRLRLGGRDVLVKAGRAANFDTMTPHSMTGHHGGAEIITILNHHGERAHLHNRH